YFFFFQAEDGIRDRNVTGVQTCALPISSSTARPAAAGSPKSPVTAIAGRRNRFTAASVSSASALRLRYPTATPAPACASIRAVARPIPLPPPVTKARLPERSIIDPTPVRNAECGVRNGKGESFAERRSPLHFRIPHSAFRIYWARRSSTIS